MRKSTDPWRDYNGPGKPITVEQLEALLRQFGIEPVRLSDGSKGYTREQIEKAWANVHKA